MNPRLARGMLLVLPPILVLGLWGGLGRLGLVPAPVGAVVAHGPLLIGGFFGGLIALERAVAIGRRLLFLAPVACALGSLALLLGHRQPGYGLLALGAGLLFVFSADLARRHAETHLSWLAAAALLLLVADLGWLLGLAPGQGLPMGLGFLVLTIHAERLELSRLVPRPRWAGPVFSGLALLFLLSTLLHLGAAPLAARLMGLSLIGLTIWLLRFDVIRSTIRQPGLPRFVAVALGLGYAWSLLGGLGLLVDGPLRAGESRGDAFTHALLLGFVLSMVMGHAPIVLPAVARVRVAFHRGLYGPLVVLNLSVLLRVAGGLLELLPLRRVSAVMSSVSLLLFVGMLVIGARRARRSR